MFRLLFGLIGIAALVAAFIYLAPDAWKERTLEFIADKPIIPDAIRKKVEDLLSTPHYRRTKLIEELEKNLGQLAEELSNEDRSAPGAEGNITPSPATERAKKIIAESKKLIEELKQQNAESPALGTAAKKLIQEIVEEQLSSKPEVQCATSTPAN